MTFIINPYVHGGEALLIEYQGNGSTNPGGATTLTITGVSCGAAFAERRLIAAVGTVDVGDGSFHAVTAVTIGGVSATQLAQSADYRSGAGLWVADVPTGTSVTVVITTSTSILSAGVGIFSANKSVTSNDSTASNSSSTSALNMDVNVQAGGYGFGVAMVADRAAGWTWTGDVTEQFEIDVRSNEMFNVALGNTPGTPASIDLTMNGSSINNARLTAGII